jgi:hypothetical protein
LTAHPSLHSRMCLTDTWPRQRKPDVIQLPLPDLDVHQQQKVSS